MKLSDYLENEVWLENIGEKTFLCFYEHKLIAVPPGGIFRVPEDFYNTFSFEQQIIATDYNIWVI